MKIDDRLLVRLAIGCQAAGLLLLVPTLFTAIPILLTLLLPAGTALVALGTVGWVAVVLHTSL